MNPTAKRAAILISGRGTNMARLVEAAADPSYPAEIVGVISDTPDAAGLLFAGSKGIETRVSSAWRLFQQGSARYRDRRRARIVRCRNRLPCRLYAYSDRPLRREMARPDDQHPPCPAAIVQGSRHTCRALDAGVRIHGCTVHFVTPETDDGPIIAQAAVPVLIGDAEETLAARVLKAEHQLYPLALRLVAEGKARMENGRTVFSGFYESQNDALTRLFSPASWSDDVDLESLARFTP